jgi:putative oxidoreductase
MSRLPASADLGLLVLRLGAGLMMSFAHGWGKLTDFGALLERFADPIGLGVRLSATLTVFAEFLCAIAVVLGFLTRLAAVPLAFAMFVAAFVVHADDPWSKKELALLYFVPFLALIIAGGGRYSLDALLFRRRGRRKA